MTSITAPLKASVKSWNILDIPAYETYLDMNICPKTSREINQWGKEYDSDVSRTDFITLTKAKKLVLEQFRYSR